MNSLEFEFEWEDPQGVKGPELRATWARLKILVDDAPVTRLLDARSHSVRDAVYCPLYPLAEWLATRWWFLSQEVESPVTYRQGTYKHRHSLLYAREGFALPDLELCPSGQETILRWEARDLPGSKVNFLTQGVAILDSQAVQDELARFITSVKARLDAEGVTGTLLHDEWDAIERCETEEREFCEVAAAMGLDPYALDEAARQRIEMAYENVPKELAAEFSQVADARNIQDEVNSLNASLAQIQHLAVDLAGLVELRRNHPPVDRSLEPWLQGYEFARAFRAQLGVNDDIPNTFARIGGAVGVDWAVLNQAILPGSANASFLDALVGTNERESPGFVLNKRIEESRRFAFCRSLFEYLTSGPHDRAALVSGAHSDRQKRNRAFAAEFLAPAFLLKRRLQSDTVDDAQLEDLSEEFAVSPRVIEHQIQNHHLAVLVPSF